MLKNNAHINELEEQHKLNGKIYSKKLKEKVEKKVKESDKLINPKHIFEKNPKNNNKKKNFRKPNIDEHGNLKQKPIQENQL
tara:strand:- start:3314 stop:3559 length:246 start_codon:yes stop_codon:yes gene_type:complete